MKEDASPYDKSHVYKVNAGSDPRDKEVKPERPRREPTPKKEGIRQTQSDSAKKQK
jgi:hypothetical protein